MMISLQASKRLYQSAIHESRAILRHHSNGIRRDSLQKWKIGVGKVLKEQRTDHERAWHHTSNRVVRELCVHRHQAMASITPDAAALLSKHWDNCNFLSNLLVGTKWPREDGVTLCDGCLPSLTVLQGQGICARCLSALGACVVRDPSMCALQASVLTAQVVQVPSDGKGTA